MTSSHTAVVRSARIALATSAHLPALIPEEQLAIRALSTIGIAAQPVVWSDGSAVWGDYDAVIIRTCWGYHTRADEFLGWIARVEQLGVPLLNPAPVIRWSANKRYLADLERAGVTVVPTRWVERDASAASLRGVMDETGWHDVVVKPAVSAGAHETWRVAACVAADEERFATLLTRGAVMVQPFRGVVTADGEWSLVFFGDWFSHAIVKRPAAGDFRVQESHGGTMQVAHAPEELRIAARQVLAHAPGPRLYARVDGCVVDGQFELMELELIEPQLYFTADAGAPDRFAAAVRAALR